jgi:hypothetical protein
LVLRAGEKEDGKTITQREAHTAYTTSSVRAIPVQVWTGPDPPRYQENRHMKVVRL